MAELDYESKRDGLMFSAKVKLLASEAPDTYAAASLHKAANNLDSHYGFSTREKKIAVVQYITKSGASSIAELCEHFPWNRDIMTHLIGELERDGKIEFYTREAAGGGRGRPSRSIRLSNGQLCPP